MESADPLYAGLSGLAIEEPIVLGKGLILTKTYAHVMSHVMLAFKEPTSPGAHHPAPWAATSQGWSYDARTQLEIPGAYAHKTASKFKIAMTIVGLLRLWSNPAIQWVVASKYPIASIAERPPPKDRELVAYAVEIHKRHFALGLVDESNVVGSLSWVAENWEIAVDLRETSAEFSLAMAVLDAGQFLTNTAMTLVSLWGALEAIFSPSAAELRFRVSAMIAAFLKPAGNERLLLQQRVAKLYDKRSAAAHGRPSHEGDDLLQTFEILRKVIIKMIENKRVPTKEDLDARLFGIDS